MVATSFGLDAEDRDVPSGARRVTTGGAAVNLVQAAAWKEQVAGHRTEGGLDLRSLKGPEALDVVGERAAQLPGPVLVAEADGHRH
jgi:hypothetical protein